MKEKIKSFFATFRKSSNMNTVDGSTTLRIKSKKRKKIEKLIIIAVIIIVIIVAIKVLIGRVTATMSAATAVAEYTTSQVERRNIENYLSATATLSPIDSYSVTTVSSVEGTVISAGFEEGDQVEEGDVLYQITTESIQSKVDTAERKVAKAEKTYNDALEQQEDLTVRAKISGYVKTLDIEVGDSVQSGSTTVAEIYNNAKMTLKIPFNEADIDSSLIGKTAKVELSDTGETLNGTVTKIAGVTEVLSGNRVVRIVTIEVSNPDALYVGMTASASIGSIYSNEDGTFDILEEEKVTAQVSGDVSRLCVKEGDWVEKGDAILVLKSESLETQIENYQDAIEDAKDSLDELIETLADYTITAPVSGTVIQKNVKAGDTLNNSSNTSLCVIYDLSAMTFEMSVDELDVMSVAVGQTVNITADAMEGIEYEGTVTNISLVGTSSGGVTEYPVTVRIDNTGDLLPGMNITGEIVIESTANALSIPADALQRGNVVYVEDSTIKEAVDDVPAGFRSVEVTTGITDGDYIEITEGLTEEDVVYVPARVSTENDMMIMMGGGQGGPQGGGQGGPQGGGQGGPQGGGQGNRDGM